MVCLECSLVPKVEHAREPKHSIAMKTKHFEILYRSFLKSRLDDFRKDEVLEFILSLVLSERRSKALAGRLIENYKTIRGVFDAPIEELELIDGMNNKTLILVKIVKEFAALYLKEKIIERDVLSSQQDVLKFLNLALSSEKVEKFYVIYLNSKNEMLGMEMVNEGSINHTVVHPRKIIEGAFKYNAISLIFVHNHPSGDATPSYNDFQLTKNLVEAVSVVDINVHDHIIVGKNTYFSGRERGWFNKSSVNFDDTNRFLPNLLHE